MKKISNDKLKEKYLINININNKNKRNKILKCLSANTSKSKELNNYFSGVGGYGLNII